MSEEQKPPFVPNDKEQATLKTIFNDLSDFRKAREKKYRFLGDRTPQRYWDEQEKRFVSYIPPKDVTEDDWQANIVMGITRNAVLSQVSKSGTRVPKTNIQTFGKEGFSDDERARIYQNAYLWSLRRENADKMQQYISLGNFIRGNTCIYEGFEDKEIEVQIITDTNDDGSFETKKQKEHKWGPKRQIVPLHEMFYPSFFVNDIQDQPKCIWKTIVNKDVAKSELGHLPKWKYVVAGDYKVGQENDPFFYSRGQLTGKQVEIVRWYGNPWKGGKDRMIVVANGIPLVDMPLPFNHKKLPFAWAKNNPFSDQFMLGMGVPFMTMDNQDMADAIMNMALDKTILSMQKPIMTDDPDPSIRSYLSPGGILQFTKGSSYQMAPIEGVTSQEFNMFQESVRQAKEFSGAFGGGSASTSRGGKVTAAQAQMMEEQTKQLLGISMSNLENLERDICVQRICNIIQFGTGSGKMIDAHEATLADGRKGRFVAFFTKTLKEAQSMENNDQQLSQIEQIGSLSGQPTEAVAIAPDWLDLTDRIEAEAVHESAYQASKSLEKSMASEDYALFQMNPLVDQEELLRETMTKKGLNPEKLIKKTPPPPPPGPEGQSPQGQEQPQLGPMSASLAGKGMAKKLSAMSTT